MWCISSKVYPFLIASKTVNSLRSSGIPSRFSSGRLLIGAALSVSSEISAPRTAFISAASKLVAMAITSPVALIWVPSTRLAVLNFSKGHLGSLTTT